MQLEKIKLEVTGREVYSKVFQLVKENLKVVYGISFLLFLFDIVNLLLGTLRTNIENTSDLLLINLFSIIFTIFSIYWSLRLSVSLIFSFNEMFNGRRKKFKETIKSSKGYIMNYLIGIIMLMLVNLVPIMLMERFSVQVEGLIGRVAVILIGLIMYLLINTTFGYLPYIKILEVNILKPYSYAKNIANKNFKIALLVLNLPVINILYGAIRENVQGRQNNDLVFEFFISSVPLLLKLIFLPLVVGGITISYILLTKKRLLQKSGGNSK